MKPILFLIVLAGQLSAELLATFQTTQGNVLVALQYDKAPQAVANFITLAQGTRDRMDPASGAITNAPLYIGEKFFRVINEEGFMIAQTGSGTGINRGGPGFSFKDEFHAELSHVPYVLSMANGGPNTNGSQIFFTGNTNIPELDGVHSVFGIITDPSSQTVIDAILRAENNGTTITGVTFSRTDTAALAFNEHAQNLPTISKAGGSLTVNPGVFARWNLSPPATAGTVFQAFRSTNLAAGSWTELTSARNHVGITPPGFNPQLQAVVLDNALSDRAFYHLSVATHPGAVAPFYLSNREMLLAFGNSDLYYQFNSSGTSGTGTLILHAGGGMNFFFTTSDFHSEAHAVTVIVENIGFLPEFPVFKISIGCDDADADLIYGHHLIEEPDGFGDWVPITRGLANMNR